MTVDSDSHGLKKRPKLWYRKWIRSVLLTAMVVVAADVNGKVTVFVVVGMMSSGTC